MRFFIVLLAISLLLLTGCTSTTQESENAMQAQIPELTVTSVPLPIPTLSPHAIEQGQTIYATYCADCHGAELQGETEWKVQNEDGTFRSPPHDETGHTWHHGDPTLLAAIRLGGARFEGADISGTSPMPAFGEILTTEEATAVLTFIKSTWPDDIRILQQEATQREQKMEN